MYGALEHYNTCKSYGIKPILGCEVYVAKKSRLHKHSKINGYNHLTLLAKNEIGFRNLVYLTSISFIEGLSSRPRIDEEVLSRHSEGLICLSGCLSSKISETCLNESLEKTIEVIDFYRSIFGHENFWLELQRNNLAIQEKVTEKLVNIHKRTGIPLVATNDIHYLRHEDCDFHDTVLCINTGSRKSESDRFRFDSDTMYFKSAAEMYHIFRDIPFAAKNTLTVSEQISFELKKERFHFPKSGHENPNFALKELVTKQLNKLGLSSNYSTRLKQELEVVVKLGFSEYFLVVKDIVEYARNNGIPVGPGRGSAAGCLISYLLGITSLDPLRHGLLFERFLNSERKGLPDIDIDFCQTRRHEIIDYIKDKYGDDRVTSIIAFNTFGPKKGIKQVGRVLEISLSETDRISRKMAADSMKESIDNDSTIAEDQSKYPKLFETAKKLEGYVEYASIHASGIIISDEPIYSLVPLTRILKNNESTVATQWDLEACEKVGLVKFDILGLETLTAIARVEKLIKARHGIDISIDSIPLDNPKVFKVLSTGDTEGVFQCYSDSMKKLLKEMKPDKFEDIISAIALLRPGPLASGLSDQYIRRKHGLEPVSYDHPSLKEIMSNTYGVMVYQEQVMKLATALAGFSPDESDNLRKAVGKKLPEELAKMEARFMTGCNTLKKVTPEVAKKTWSDILEHGRYSFNIAHSASYALLSYYTAYLKGNYTVEFLCGNLTQEMNNFIKFRAFISDVKMHGLTLLPPCITKSSYECTIEDKDTVRLGLGSIKGVPGNIHNGSANSNILVSLAKTFSEVSPSKRSIELLAMAGALDRFKVPRVAIVEDSENLAYLIRQYIDNTNAGISSLFGSKDPEWTPLSNVQDSNEKILSFEKIAFGFYLSGHPMEALAYRAKATGSYIVSEFLRSPQAALPVCGTISSIEIKAVKGGPNKGRKYARILLEDQHGEVPATLFTNKYDQFIDICKSALNNSKPVIIKGKAEEGSNQIHINSVSLLEEEKDSTHVKLLIPNEINIKTLISILKLYPGDQLVSLYWMSQADKVINLSIGVTMSKELWSNLYDKNL